MRYEIRAWSTDEVLSITTNLRDARAEARRILGVRRAVRQDTDIPGSIPHGALEGWHANHTEGCGSVLIYRC